MKTFLTVVEIVIAIGLTALILLQAKGVGLGRSLGSVAYHSRRGVEHLVFRATILLAISFTILAIANHLFI